MPARRKRRQAQHNYYKILGISPQANQEAIKKAFRRKARKTHPDTEEGSHQAFKLVKKAYETLSDPHQRDLYDLRNGFKPSPPPRERETHARSDHQEWPDFENLVESFAQFLETQWWDEEDYERRREN
ncbi:MAG: DnaJ domain-containing protein [Planctomycetota bacterium]